MDSISLIFNPAKLFNPRAKVPESELAGSPKLVALATGSTTSPGVLIYLSVG
ncbi:hypothetical protein D3C80_1800440 [compost metagenome]